MDLAALYLRSSKDRADVAPDAQRRELMDLAKAKGLTVVETFQDAVERADDESRPGFQAMLRSLKSSSRQWNHILTIDTARIARGDQYLAAAFNYECERRGVKVLYAKLPETNTIMDVVIRGVIRSFDQLHSLMSKEKGLAGMAENVKQGWRAGGRAPMGYRLEHIPTGAIRDGHPVTKSRLVASPEAPAVAAYLKARAAGISRRKAMEDAGLRKITDSTLVGMEWNALTYAGHTVWNVHAEKAIGGGYKGGSKRRPRSQWVINHDTHQALITTEEAETLVAALEAGRPKGYRTKSDYLLSGLLQTPDGRAWHSDGDGCYRLGKGLRISQASIESMVVGTMRSDLVSPVFSTELVKEARRMSLPPEKDQLQAVAGQIEALTKKIARLADFAAETEHPRPFLDQISSMEKERAGLTARLASLELDQESATVLRAMNERDVTGILSTLADHMAVADRAALKEMVGGLVEKIELCPTSQTARLHYRIAAGDLLASPRGFEPRFIP